MKRWLPALAAASLILACDQDPTKPPVSSVDALDGAQFSVVGPVENPYFAFLAPLSGGGSGGGDFDPTLNPTVTVCAWSGATCVGSDIAVFASGGADGVGITGKQYHVNWNTKASALVAGTTYRIRVEVHGAEVGHTDVLAVDGKNATKAPKGVYALRVGSTLPIKFHVGIGAVPPTAVMSVTGELQAGGTTTFDASGSTDRYGSPLSYAWDFGDGVRGGGGHIAHTYTDGRSYTVRLVVTNDFGLSGMAASAVDIAGGPMPTGEARIVGKVRDTSGDPLNGVSVRLVGGSASATTNASGSVVLEHVPAGVAAVLTLTKSGYADQVVEVSVPTGSDGAIFELSMAQRAPALTLASAAVGGTVTGQAGASVSLPPAGLVNGAGQPVSGAVSVSVTPIDVANDLAAFPGSFTGVQATGEEGTLMTYGVAEYVLTSGSEEVQLALGKKATIEIPIYAGAPAVGDAIPLWSLDERTGKWIAEGMGTVVASSDSPTGLALRGEVSHLSWWNADIFVSTPYGPHVTCSDAGTSVACSVRGTVLDPSFPRSDPTANVPAGGLTLVLPPDVDVLLRAISSDGTLRGSTTVNGSSGGTGSVDIAMTVTAASAATSTVSLSASTVTYNQTLTATLQARDADGNELTAGGDIVVFVAPTSGLPRSTVTIGPTVDNGDGTYSAPLTGVGIGTAVEVGATVNGVAVPGPLPSVEVTFQGASPADIEALLAGGYHTWFYGNYNYSSAGMALSNAAFQHNAPWANAGMEKYGRIPRIGFINSTTDGDYNYMTRSWFYSYRAISEVAIGLRAMEDPFVAEALGPDALLRDRAYGYFVLGMAHATLAILFDQAFVVDETTGAEPQSLQPYEDVIAAAMGYFDEAISLSQSASWTLPEEWMKAALTGPQLASVAHSMKARYRAGVARTPAERAVVNWAAVIADIDAGVSTDFVAFYDDMNGWNWDVGGYATDPGWGQAAYFIYGMADQSGNFQIWNAASLEEKSYNVGDTDILIITPDQRFPQGSTVYDQRVSESTNRYFRVNRQNETGGTWARPDRGKWRWSWYKHNQYEDYWDAANYYVAEIRMEEMDLLKAEGLFRLDNKGGAADLINISRTRAGLDATDAAGINTNCVPKLPDGSCGDLWEMLKWEKRLETIVSGPFAAGWYFDSRGWGDLFVGTPLQYPVPCAELQALGMGCYTFGGVGGPWAAPISTYHYPDEG